MTSAAREHRNLVNQVTNQITEMNDQIKELTEQVHAVEVVLKSTPWMLEHPNMAHGFIVASNKTIKQIGEAKIELIKKFSEAQLKLAQSFNTVKLVRKLTALPVAVWRDFRHFENTLEEIAREFNNSPRNNYDLVVSFEDGNDEDIKFHSWTADAIQQFRSKLAEGTLIPIRELD